jgi:hypothetical protein
MLILRDVRSDLTGLTLPSLPTAPLLLPKIELVLFYTGPPILVGLYGKSACHTNLVLGHLKVAKCLLAIHTVETNVQTSHLHRPRIGVLGSLVTPCGVHIDILTLAVGALFDSVRYGEIGRHHKYS